MEPKHNPENKNTDIKDMKIAFWLNLSFSIIEFIWGVLTNSFAIIADAFHDLGDSVALGVGIFLEKFSKKSPSERYTFGYKRFSLLSAFILSAILISGSIAMIVKSIENFSSPETVSSWGMVGLAFLGVFVNGVVFWRMSRKSNQNSANTRAMTLHFLEDVLGWIAVLVGGVIMYFTDWYWIDAVLTMLIAVLILSHSVPTLISVFKIFLQIAPSDINVWKLRAELESIANISKIYVWTEDGESHIGVVHAMISEKNLQNMDEIRKKMEKIFAKNNIFNTTIQLEIKK